MKLARYIVAVGVLAGVVGASATIARTQPTVEAQSADSIYVTPASANYKVGDTVAVEVRVNTSGQVNAVEAHFNYSNSLQFVSIDGSGSAFGIDASSMGGSGSVSIAKGTITPVSGDQLVTKVTFKAVAAGTGSLQMLGTSQALSATTNQNVATARNGGNYAIAAVVTPSTPATTTAPPVTPKPSTSSKPSTSTSTTTPTTKTSVAKVSIAPQGNAATTPLPGDSVVELQAPVTIETTPDTEREVTKVEYLLNGKVISTDTSPPYSQSVDTTKLRNGTYTLTTKTYYKDGKVDTSTSSLVVNNPFSAEQMWLQLKHYAWLIALLLAIAGGLVYLKFFRGHGKYPYGKNDASGDVPTNSGHGTIVVGGTPPSVQSIVTGQANRYPPVSGNI